MGFPSRFTKTNIRSARNNRCIGQVIRSDSDSCQLSTDIPHRRGSRPPRRGLAAPGGSGGSKVQTGVEGRRGNQEDLKVRKLTNDQAISLDGIKSSKTPPVPCVVCSSFQNPHFLPLTFLEYSAAAKPCCENSSQLLNEDHPVSAQIFLTDPIPIRMSIWSCELSSLLKHESTFEGHTLNSFASYRR